jgi:hypothetical protein
MPSLKTRGRDRPYRSGPAGDDDLAGRKRELADGTYGSGTAGEVARGRWRAVGRSRVVERAWQLFWSLTMTRRLD